MGIAKKYEYVTVDSVDTLEQCTERVKKAQEIYSTFTQEQVDKIFFEAAKAANQMRIPLAKLAVQETGMGVVEDKVLQNHFAAEYIYNAYRDTSSDLSFAIALLDEANNGIVLNGIYSREMSNIYAKPIQNGKSSYIMTQEEQDAVFKAMNEEDIRKVL